MFFVRMYLFHSQWFRFSLEQFDMLRYAGMSFVSLLLIRLLYTFDVNFLHLKHCLHHSFCLLWIRVT